MASAHLPDTRGSTVCECEIAEGGLHNCVLSEESLEILQSVLMFHEFLAHIQLLIP